MARPVIAITGPQRGAIGPRLLVAMAIRLYGGNPLQLRPGDEQRDLEYHGVVVTGGHDVEPVLYAAEPEIEPNYDTARDALEIAVINDALERKLPLLGICRGNQLLNICRGGSLHQELRSRRRQTSNRGIDRVGDGLVVTGRDLDGIVQAIEDPSRDFLLGVQWHPEFLLYMRRQRALFKEVVRHAKIHKEYIDRLKY